MTLTAWTILAVSLGAVFIRPEVIVRSILGALGLPVAPVPPEDAMVILGIRLPRVMAAILAGAGLGVSGTVMQGVFRNPLAEPGILGVSAGGTFSALLAISFGIASFFILPLFAFVGAMVAVAMILGISWSSGGRSRTVTLVMGGMAISALFGALTSLTLSFAKQYQVASFIFWTMGGLTNRRWEHVLALIGPVLLTLAGIIVLARDLDILLLGDQEARALGVPPGRTRLLLILLASVCTASIVALAGPIAFVGLLVPHIMRLIVGPAHRPLAVASAFGGAVFLLACDLVTRLIAWPQGAELPVGVITALIGAPYFLFLLYRSARRGSIPT